MKKLNIALAALAAASTLAPSALAQGARAVHIDMSSIDLNSPEGADQLLTRIRAAAAKVCDDPNSAVKSSWTSCERDVVADTVARLNINALGVAFTDAFGERPALAQK